MTEIRWGRALRDRAKREQVPLVVVGYDAQHLEGDGAITFMGVSTPGLLAAVKRVLIDHTDLGRGLRRAQVAASAAPSASSPLGRAMDLIARAAQEGCSDVHCVFDPKRGRVGTNGGCHCVTATDGSFTRRALAREMARTFHELVETARWLASVNKALLESQDRAAAMEREAVALLEKMDAIEELEAFGLSRDDLWNAVRAYREGKSR